MIASARTTADFIPVALATLEPRAPIGPEWIHEEKLDGYRIEAVLSVGAVRLFSRNHKDWTLRFPGGATALFDCGMNLERRNLLEVVGTAGRLYLDNPFSLLDEDSVLEEYHFGQDSTFHEVKGANPFVRMAEHFADAVLNGTPLRYGLQDSVGNAYVIDALARAARKEAGA